MSIVCASTVAIARVRSARVRRGRRPVALSGPPPLVTEARRDLAALVERLLGGLELLGEDVRVALRVERERELVVVLRVARERDDLGVDLVGGEQPLGVERVHEGPILTTLSA